MKVGVPKEIKNHEYRVGLTPSSVRQLVQAGHEVLVEANAGSAIGFSNQRYQNAGARIIDSVDEIFATADLIIKVKEPQPQECEKLKPGQILFTYLHLAPDSEQTELLLKSGCIAIAYETVTDAQGNLPLLAPMSEVAGRMAVQVGARCLENSVGGLGVLLGGVPGVEQAQVCILGGGVVGTNAARIALGMGARVSILDKSVQRLRALDEGFGFGVQTLYATPDEIEKQIKTADLVIGAVLVPGAAAPKLIRREMLATMQPGAVLVDVAIDQGGCFETSRATTHDNPSYLVDGVIHYCVANMPGAVARTSTIALNNATVPYVLALANHGGKPALLNDPYLCQGLNICEGHLTHAAVAQSQNRSYVTPQQTLTKL
jgi:alanine dehydrogenase